MEINRLIHAYNTPSSRIIYCSACQVSADFIENLRNKMLKHDVKIAGIISSHENKSCFITH